MAAMGFIGLGIMGKPMAGHLLDGGGTLHLFDTDPTRMEELAAKGALECGSCREVAEKSEFIFLMLPDTSDVEQVLFGDGGAMEGLSRGNIVVDMSSISPVVTREFSRRLAEQGVEMLDAPVSGGSARSRILEVHGRRMLEHDFEPGFRIRHQQKDLNNALSAARRLGLSLPATSLVQELFSAAAANEGGETDHSALVTALECMANHKLS